MRLPEKSDVNVGFVKLLGFHHVKVGDKCEALKGRGNFYPGKISKVNSDGTVSGCRF